MKKEDFIKACNATIEKKEKEIEFLKNFIHSVEVMPDDIFESIPFSIDIVNTVEEINEIKEPDDILDIIDWDELYLCSSTGEPFPEDEKNLLSTIGLVSECKEDFVDKLYTYGYTCVEDLMFNYDQHYQTTYVDFDCITNRIGSINYNLSDLAKLYFALQKVRGITIKHHNKYNIDYDKYKDIMANYPEYSRILIDTVLDIVTLKDNIINKSKKRITNVMRRAGIKTVLDLLIVKDIDKLAKDTRTWGNEITKWAKVIINEYSDV